MSSGKEIRTKIKSIQNTQKITKAMEMVAASKMRRAQETMEKARPYAEKIRTVISHVGHAQAEYKHPYLTERNINRAGYIIVSTDRGLCGGLNANMFRGVVREFRELDEKGIDIDLCTIGSKATRFFRRFKANMVAEKSGIGDVIRVSELIGTVKVMLDQFVEGKIDALYLVFNEFVNTMTQKPNIEKILPIAPDKPTEELAHPWDYIYEPEAKDVLEQLCERYIESLVYQAVVENYACEQAARMVAMKAASDNAGNIIDDLQLAYNKARQAAITKELSEIVAGAAAV